MQMNSKLTALNFKTSYYCIGKLITNHFDLCFLMTELLGVFIDMSIPTTMSRKRRFKTKLQLKNHVLRREKLIGTNYCQLLFP